MSNTLREKIIAMYSANFNDGVNIDTRVGSRDMVLSSCIVEFIDDYILNIIQSEINKARIDEITEMIVTEGCYPTDRQYTRAEFFYVIDKNDVDKRLSLLKGSCEHGCKGAGVHHHESNPSIETKGESNESI